MTDGDLYQYDPDVQLDLGALASGAITSVNTKLDAARGQGFFLKSFGWTGEYIAKTASEGPILWGWSLNMTATEINVKLNNDPSSDADAPARGGSMWMRPQGMIRFGGTAGALHGGNGEDWVTRQNVMWSLREGQAMNLWARNIGTILTDGASLNVSLDYIGKWLRD